MEVCGDSCIGVRDFHGLFFLRGIFPSRLRGQPSRHGREGRLQAALQDLAFTLPRSVNPCERGVSRSNHRQANRLCGFRRLASALTCTGEVIPPLKPTCATVLGHHSALEKG